MWSKVLILFLIGSPTVLSADVKYQCDKNGRYRIETKPGVYEEKKVYLCSDAKNVHFATKDCADSISTCVAMNANAENEPVKLPGDIGSPGFKACEFYGGTPQFVEFKTKKGWEKAAICSFRNMKSFVDTDQVLGLLKNVKGR